MKKEFLANSTTAIVEGGIIKLNGHEINGYRIDELQNAPKPVQDQCRKAGVDFKACVYYGGAVIPREYAEEALKQKKEIQEEKERQLKSNEPGLDILREAYHDIERYHDEFNRMMDDEYNDGVNPPALPRYDIETLKAQYPRASAYLKAENWEMSSNYEKSDAGQKAKDAIAAGADIDETIKAMEAQWEAYCNDHIWD